jgi:hypothetical protein
MNSLGPRNPSVVRFGSGYVMAYFYGGNITYASSSEGLTWYSTAAPLIVNPANGSQADMPTVVNSGSTLNLWYTEFLSDGSQRVDFAVCGILLIKSTVSTTTTISNFVTITSVISKTVTATFVSTLAENQAPASWFYPTLLATVAVIALLTTAAVFLLKRK